MCYYCFRCFTIPTNTKALSQRLTICCIDVVSSLEMKVSPTSDDKVVPKSRGDVVATLWQRSAYVVPKLCQSCKVVTLQSTSHLTL